MRINSGIEEGHSRTRSWLGEESRPVRGGPGLGAGCCRSSAVEEMEGACHLEAETGGFAVPGSQVAREPGLARTPRERMAGWRHAADAYRDSIW